MYIKYFHDAFENDEGWTVVNRLWQVGISSLFFNLDAKVFVIQWVDLIPYKRLGKIQFIFFLLGVLLLKVFKKKILWVLHNKYSHKGKSKFVDLGMKFLSHFSDIVVTHSQEGVSFYKEKYPNSKAKVHYIPHPVYNDKFIEPGDIKWDYIIWGSVCARKNICGFLESVNANCFWKEKKVLIAGKCNDPAYEQRVLQLLPKNFCFENKFFSDEELAERIKKSRCILFTYNEGSVLSSGALIYSLNFMKPIIGPKVGSFADLPGIVSCYDNLADINKVKLNFNGTLIECYMRENVWSLFPVKISSIFSV